MQSRRITTAVLALLSAFSIAACSDDDDDDGPVGGNNLNTTVRFVNATTGGTNLDIAQNGTVGTGNSAISYGNASSCTKVNNADPKLAVRTAGSTTSLTGFTPNFAANGTYTVLVTGTTTAPVFTTLNDQFTAPTGTNAGVRIVNATSSATTGGGNWDIYVNPGATLGTAAATNVGRNTATTYLTVPAGVTTNTIRLTNAGSTTTLQNITLPSQTAGTVTTIVVGDAATAGGQLRTFTLAPCT